MFRINNSLTKKIFIFIFPVLALTLFSYLRLADFEYYKNLVKEDSIIENATALMYFISAIIAIRIAFSFYEKNNILCIVYGLLAIGMFFVTGEEVSWGQRFLHLAPSRYFIDNNSQSEINFHNLHPIQSILHKIYIFVGLYGALLWVGLIAFQKNKYIASFRYVIPEWYLSSYFFQVVVFYFYFDYIKPENNFLNITWQEQEPVEAILSIGFLLFTMIALRMKNQEN